MLPFTESHFLSLLISFSIAEVKDSTGICLKIFLQQSGTVCDPVLPQLRGSLWEDLTIKTNKLYKKFHYQKKINNKLHIYIDHEKSCSCQISLLHTLTGTPASNPKDQVQSSNSS